MVHYSILGNPRGLDKPYGIEANVQFRTLSLFESSVAPIDSMINKQSKIKNKWTKLTCSQEKNHQETCSSESTINWVDEHSDAHLRISIYFLVISSIGCLFGNNANNEYEKDKNI